jgi:hypothetical protein
MKIKDA